ncbi:MAG: outer-membrane lipoprotein carrier protein LolA [Treponema sp.]|nr:outer-membrane lipoprotein carrier protein LolA [Treponema sp.]
MVKKKLLFAFLLAGGVIFSGFSQEIVTAGGFLETVAERYAAIRDYEARVIIRSDTTEMTGNLSFLQPYFLRIDFTNPADQVLIFTGDLLTVHDPRLRTVLNQAVTPIRRSGAAGGASLASAQGLQLLRRGYVATFVTGPEPVPLAAGSPERVVQLRLTRRLTSENFREIILSVNPETLMIRRIEARTLTNALVFFDFTDIRTNVGIPEQRFAFVAPPTANMHNNFLFRETN